MTDKECTDCFAMDEFQMDSKELYQNFPPILNDDNKLLVLEIATKSSGGYPFAGKISYKRWRGVELPKSLEMKSKFSANAGIFKYAPQNDANIVDWHLNFADPYLFRAYGSSLLAQDEIQVAEHPILGSVREMLIFNSRCAQTVDNDWKPTPVTITGAQRGCVIDTSPNPDIGCPDGLYGNAFHKASADQVRAVTTCISPPTLSNILAICAPEGGYGNYTIEDIIKVLHTAYTGFYFARQESKNVVKKHPKTVIHTGFWGCGAFGGNRILMTILQCIAADLANVDIEFWAFDAPGVKIAEEAYSRYKALGNGNVFNILKILENEKFQWGESDGN